MLTLNSGSVDASSWSADPNSCSRCCRAPYLTRSGQHCMLIDKVIRLLDSAEVER